MGKLEIYKRTQGKYTRLLTFFGIVGIGGIGAVLMGKELAVLVPTEATLAIGLVRYALPVVLIAGLALLMFWVVNRPKSADFLIATEGEMKKVSWASRREVVGSTKVVLVTTLILTCVLLAVDLVFIFTFTKMGVMG